MLKNVLKRWTSLFLVTVLVIGFLPAVTLEATAAESEVASGVTASGDYEIAIGGIMVKATSTAFKKGEGCGSSDTNAASATATAALTNTLTGEANLSFDYEINIDDKESDGFVKIDGEAQTANGHFEKTIASNAKVNIEVFSGTPASDNDTKIYTSQITITNLSLAENRMVTTTFQPDTAGGTYTVDGTAVNAEFTHTKNAQETTTLKAVPAGGYKFFGWYSVTDSTYVSKNADWTTNLTKEQIIKPVFAPLDAPTFQVGAGNEFFDLNEAVHFAQGNNQQTVVLVADGTLPAGDYTIPSGVTLLIPFDDAHTCYTDIPGNTANNFSAPSVFRKLTLAPGVNIQVDGAISVSAKHSASMSGANPTLTGAVTGPYGQLAMEAGSTITVNSGANLYVWGYVTGDGTIQAKSGSCVHECFQISDWRGGSATASMNGNKYKVFPLSQYYFQNIEVLLTLEAGAREKLYTSIYAGSATTSTTIDFISNQDSSLFVLKSGTLTKHYNPELDRVTLTVNGDLDINKLAITVKQGFTITVSSDKYVLPITSNLTVDIQRGNVTLKNDVSFLPGVKISVAQDAMLTVEKNLYLYDYEDWVGKGFVGAGGDLRTVNYTPEKGGNVKKIRTAADSLPDAALYLSGMLQVNGQIYTTEHGANITGSDTGEVVYRTAPADGSLYGSNQSGTSVTYPQVIITPAKLKNAAPGEEGTYNAYTQTTGAAAGDIFSFADGTWDNLTQSGPQESNAYYPHVPATVEGEEAEEATCTTPGKAAGTRCSVCGKVLAEQKEIPALGHDYTAEEDAWTWEKNEEDGSYIAKITLTCQRDGCEEGHTKTEDAVVTSAETKVPTCTEKGEMTYTATVTVDGQEYTDTKVEDMAVLAHNLTKTEAKAATCTTDGNQEYWTCTACNKVFSDAAGTDETSEEAVTIPATGHKYNYNRPAWNWTKTDGGYAATAIFTCAACTDGTEGHTKTETAVVSGPEVVDATCTTKGSETYTATVTAGEGTSKTDTKVVEIAINPEAHNWGDWTTGNESEHTRTCKHNSSHTETVSHVWDEGKVTQQATCTKKGVKTFTCSVCSATKTEESDALGHEFTVFQSWGEWTAAEGGYTRQAVVKCSRCDTTEAQDAQVTGPVVKPSSCTENGSNTYTSTWGEGANQKTDTKVDAIEELAEHTWGEGLVTTEATCTEKGVKTVTCSVCSTTRTEEIDALGHDFANSFTVDQEATCTEKGSKSKHCSRCDAKTDVTEIDTTNHNEVVVAGKPATCTEAGLTDGTKCSVCGSPITAQTPIPATGHTSAAAVRENEKAASCMEEGSYDEVVYCSVCKLEISRVTKTIAKIAHTMTKTDAKPATCGHNGNTEYYTCEICKNLFTDAEGKNPITSDAVVIVASEHLSVVKDQAVEPTCTTGGKTEGSHCEACNTVIVQQEDIPATGHQLIETTTPATCTAEGVKVSTCTVCDFKESTPILKLGHIYGDWTTVRQATCTEAGEQQRICTRNASHVETQPIPATGHDYTGVQPEWNWRGDNSADASFACATCHKTTVVEATVTHEVTQATCTGEGMTIYTANATFNGTEYTAIKDSLHVAPTGHAYANPSWSWSDDFSVAYVTFTCTSCGIQTELPAEITQEIKDASCTANGSITYTATVWTDDSRQTVWAVDSQVKTITASGHLPTPIFAIPVSCESSGWTEGTRCSVCQEILTSPQEIPATGHDWLSGRTEVTVQPTCSAEGVQIRHCAKDDSHTQTEVIQKLEHNTISMPAVPATCIEPGHSAYTHCGLCGQDFGKEVYSPTGHHYGTPVYTWQQNDLGGWAAVARFICDNCVSFQDVNASEIKSEDTRTATCMEDGNRHFTAVFAFNGNSYTSEKDAVIPALGHKAVVDAAKAPTCTETGLTEGSHCETCGSVLTAQETVDATGHYYEMAWLWTETGASLNVVCRNDQTHAGSVQATVEQSTTPATIQAAGKTVYTATVVFDGKEYTAKREVTIPQLVTPDYSTPSDPVIFPPVSVWTSDPAPSTGSTVTNIDDFETPLADMFGIGTVNGKGNSQFVITVTDITHESDTTTHGNETVIAVTAKLGDTVMKTVPGGITAAVPVENSVSGTVAVLVRSDGTEQVIRKSVTDGNTLYVPLDGTANIVVRDNSKWFVDVHDRDWYAPAVAFVSSHDLFGGTTPTTFEPSTAMSRAMLAKVLHNLEDNPHPTSMAQFTDMKAGAWYNSAVSWASEQQIITGYPDGRFGVNDDVSRQDMIVMLWRYAGKPAASTSTLPFSDADKVSPYAREAMLWATENRIISGKGENKLDPLGNAQRSEVAQIIQNYVRYLVK